MCFSTERAFQICLQMSLMTESLFIVYHPSNFKANWFRMIVNLIIDNYPDGLDHLEGDGGNEIHKNLISINSRTEPNKNEQTLDI